jgi:hypothetical protein
MSGSPRRLHSRAITRERTQQLKSSSPRRPAQKAGALCHGVYLCARHARTERAAEAEQSLFTGEASTKSRRTATTAHVGYCMTIFPRLSKELLSCCAPCVGL